MFICGLLLTAGLSEITYSNGYHLAYFTDWFESVLNSTEKYVQSQTDILHLDTKAFVISPHEEVLFIMKKVVQYFYVTFHTRYGVMTEITTSNWARRPLTKMSRFH